MKDGRLVAGQDALPARSGQEAPASDVASLQRRTRGTSSLVLFPIWPRRPSTALALATLTLLQAALFFAVTQRAFFATDDFHHFLLAQERSFLHYLVSPILGVYPAPGHRLVTFLLHEVFPLNYVAARIFLLVFLAGITVLLGQLTRTLAHSEEWWTVALLAPFALSLTLVSPVWWWSNGVPVIPGLFFTAVVLYAWLRSYTDARQALWIGVALVAVAAAGAFTVKFLLIPAYLLLIRLVILPQLLHLRVGLRPLLSEKARWIAVTAPPALYVAVFALSGLSSMASGARASGRLYLEYFGAAWFHTLVPVSFLNAPLDSAAAFSVASWSIVIASQVLFFTVVSATWRRSALALRGWAFFMVVFALNAAMAAGSRLGAFGVDIAYWLRYYPEVVFFLPLVLGLTLRQGGERRSSLAWERTKAGQAAIGFFSCLFVISFLVWAPRIVSESDGALGRVWFDNLRQDLAVVPDDASVLRVVDSDTPEYVMPSWMADHRVSTIFGLLGREAVYNELPGPIYVVLDDGHLVEAAFEPITSIVAGTTLTDGVSVVGRGDSESAGTCLRENGELRYRPSAEVTDGRLAIRVLYSQESRYPAVAEVESSDPDREFRRLQLRPDVSAGELADLGTSRLRALTLKPADGGDLCIKQVELGALPTRDPVVGRTRQAD